MSPNLAKMIERIDKAAADDKIFGIMIHLNDAALGRGKVDELRSAILRARKSGKKVYAELNESTSAGYLLATACDEIIMPPVGRLTISGVRMEITYYKSLFDKLGIKADMLQVGDYKGAAEPMTRDKMSPEFRKQTEVVIDDFYNQLIETLSQRSQARRGQSQGPHRRRPVHGPACQRSRPDRSSGLRRRIPQARGTDSNMSTI